MSAKEISTFISVSVCYSLACRAVVKVSIGGFHAILGDTNNKGEIEQMLVDKQNELMSNLLFTVHQHGGDGVTWKPPIPGTIHKVLARNLIKGNTIFFHAVWSLSIMNTMKMIQDTKGAFDREIRI